MKTPPLIYCDHQNIYLEWPGHPPAIAKYPLTEGGMCKVLKAIPNIAPPSGSSSTLHLLAARSRKLPKATLRARELRQFPEDQSNAAMEIIKRGGRG